MIVWGALAQILWGLLLKSISTLEKLHLVYAFYENTVLFNLVLGALLGLAYVLFELPNSFIKRRLEIREGKTAENGWKWTFIWIDQIDSLIGCIIFLLFVSFAFVMLYATVKMYKMSAVMYPFLK